MHQWFNQLRHREQIIIGLGAVSLAIYLLYILLWQPLHDNALELERQNENLMSSLDRVDAMALEIEGLRHSGRQTTVKKGSLQQILNSAAKRHGLTASRIQPNAKGEIQMRFEGIPAQALIAWLHELEQQRGILIQDASINTTATANRLNAVVRLAQGN